ncbi:MAG: hypothetical protein KatS3mg104_0897 [Phycisphaerae bacterium]|nr:MAG: hypothetical protein KatS3mg104_0897 [Phycisphaerae bacterium]
MSSTSSSPSTAAIESVQHENRIFHPPVDFVRQARIRSIEEYQKLWKGIR